MKRLFDLVIGLMLLFLLAMPMVLIAIAIHLTSRGPILYWSDRVGQGGVIFKMPKFRSMQVDTPVVATHLMTDPHVFLSPVGRFLRRYSMDEFPQLFSILKGEMSFVGPRPALFNQDDLITLRKEKGAECLVPGLTGLAQVNGRDDLSIPDKVALDVEYMNYQSFWFDLKILWMTFLKVVKGNGVSH
jgi:O-antigen biosynthesis protein WbqP